MAAESAVAVLEDEFCEVGDAKGLEFCFGDCFVVEWVDEEAFEVQHGIVVVGFELGHPRKGVAWRVPGRFLATGRECFKEPTFCNRNSGRQLRKNKVGSRSVGNAFIKSQTGSRRIGKRPEKEQSGFRRIGRPV